MKRLLVLLLALCSLSAVADTPNWIKIDTTTDFVIYLDDANVVDEDGYSGFNVRITYPVPVVTSDGETTIVSGIYLFEYNCETTNSRGKRLHYVDDKGKEYLERDTSWWTVSSPPIPDVIAAVKARVCFHAHLGSPQRR